MAKTVYEIMHKNRKVARIDDTGFCKIYYKTFMPYNLYFEEDLSTNGCFPKAWKRVKNGFVLLKDGGSESVERELLASKICQCFDVSQVVYTEDVFDHEKVTRSENITSKDYSIASMELMEIYAQNHDRDIQKYILSLDRHNYYMMNIIDYLVGNTDRHWGNWGVLVKTSNNKPVALHKLMDFNQAFYSYDTMEGANCQTTFGVKMNQQEAAAEAVKKIGMHQLHDIKKNGFPNCRNIMKCLQNDIII